MREEEERLLEVSKAERSKSDSLTEVRRLELRLKERPGRKCSVCLLPYCRSRYKNLEFVWVFQILKKHREQTNVSFL